jgi:S-adenosylmethionine decarboxylase
MANNNLWGYHLMLDCSGCDIEMITDMSIIKKFVNKLVDKINMKAFGEPLIQHFAEHNKEVAGYSLVQLIETSSITGHFVDKNGDAYIDIFSCKNFDITIAKAVVEDFFSPSTIKVSYLERSA